MRQIKRDAFNNVEYIYSSVKGRNGLCECVWRLQTLLRRLMKNGWQDGKRRAGGEDRDYKSTIVPAPLKIDPNMI